MITPRFNGAVAALSPYPAYSGSSTVKGMLVLGGGATGGLNVLGSVSGLAPSTSGGWHVHSGVTCASVQSVFAHYWPEMATDPWLTVTYTTDERGVATISSATTPAEYSDSVDQLTVWLIGKGSLPEGIEAGAVRDVIQDTYESLPQKGYACEMTRTNKGVCFSPGEPADSAYKTSIAQLRKYATRKGKGSLMSDGVSAANSAAF